MNGRPQLVGQCVDVTLEGWNNPIPITEPINPDDDDDNKEEEEVDYHGKHHLTTTMVRYGECGFIAPDFEAGLTCWDFESGIDKIHGRLIIIIHLELC